MEQMPKVCFLERLGLKMISIKRNFLRKDSYYFISTCLFTFRMAEEQVYCKTCAESFPGTFHKCPKTGGFVIANPTSSEPLPEEAINLEFIFKIWHLLVLTLKLARKKKDERRMIEALGRIFTVNITLLEKAMSQFKQIENKNCDQGFITMFLNDMEKEKDVYKNKDLKELLEQSVVVP